MQKFSIEWLGLLFILTVLGCASKEEKARTLLNTAITAEREAKPAEYEAALRNIVANFPSTTVATEANNRLLIAEKEDSDRRKVGTMTMRTIQTCQVVYLSEHRGKFASGFDALDADCQVTKMTDPEKGYTYQMTTTPTGNDFNLHATPARPDDPYLFLDSTDGTLRSELGKVAGAQSPKVKD